MCSFEIIQDSQLEPVRTGKLLFENDPFIEWSDKDEWAVKLGMGKYEEYYPVYEVNLSGKRLVMFDDYGGVFNRTTAMIKYSS